MADKLERLREMRDEYEAALDGAARLRDEYHREVVKLHRGGMSLREIADALGISHQRVHQIVSPPEDEAKRPRRKTTGTVVASAIILCLVASGAVLLMADRGEEPPVAYRATPSDAPSVAQSREVRAACKQFRELFRNQRDVTSNVDCRDVTFVPNEATDALTDLSAQQRHAIGEYLIDLFPRLSPS